MILHIYKNIVLYYKTNRYYNWFDFKTLGVASFLEKPERLLYIYTRLLNGKTISKEALSQKLQVNIRTIQRDISDINNFIYEDHEWHGLEGKVI